MNKQPYDSIEETSRFVKQRLLSLQKFICNKQEEGRAGVLQSILHDLIKDGLVRRAQTSDRENYTSVPDVETEWKNYVGAIIYNHSHAASKLMLKARKAGGMALPNGFDENTSAKEYIAPAAEVGPGEWHRLFSAEGLNVIVASGLFASSAKSAHIVKCLSKAMLYLHEQGINKPALEESLSDRKSDLWEHARSLSGMKESTFANYKRPIQTVFAFLASYQESAHIKRAQWLEALPNYFSDEKLFKLLTYLSENDGYVRLEQWAENRVLKIARSSTPDKAVELFGEIKFMNSRSAVARKSMAECYFEMEKLAEAEREMHELIACLNNGKLKAKRADFIARSYNLYGDIHFEMKNEKQALASYERSHQIDPTQLDSSINIINVLSILDRRQEAVNFVYENDLITLHFRRFVNERLKSGAHSESRARILTVLDQASLEKKQFAGLTKKVLLFLIMLMTLVPLSTSACQIYERETGGAGRTSCIYEKEKGGAGVAIDTDETLAIYEKERGGAGMLGTVAET